MGKILESLPLTILTGVVLTVIMIYATDAIYDSQMSAPEKAVADIVDSM